MMETLALAVTITLGLLILGIALIAAAAFQACDVSLDPIRLLVVEKEAGGMADALNAGVNAAQYPVIGIVDREAEFIPELLLRLIRPMLGDWERTVAVCGVAPAPPE